MPPVSPAGIHHNSLQKLAVALIPARFDSRRLPGKPLAEIAGRTMIEHVYRRAQAARSIRAVIVATDDERISAAVRAFGGEAVMTRSTHRSGMERLAEAAAAITAPLLVNVQGDEPLVDPAMIDQAVAPLLADPSITMTTVCRRIEDRAEYESPHVVKVVVDQAGDALYFSRSPIPFASREADGARLPAAFKHVGLYAYRRDFLLMLAALPPTPLEQAESLEQLRALEHGYRIKVVETTFDSLGVDTPEDLDRVRQILAVGTRV